MKTISQSSVSGVRKRTLRICLPWRVLVQPMSIQLGSGLAPGCVMARAIFSFANPFYCLHNQAVRFLLPFINNIQRCTHKLDTNLLQNLSSFLKEMRSVLSKNIKNQQFIQMHWIELPGMHNDNRSNNVWFTTWKYKIQTWK